MNTTLTDTLDEAIERAAAKCHALLTASFEQAELFGALQIACYLRGYMNVLPDVDPAMRDAVAKALELVTR